MGWKRKRISTRKIFTRRAARELFSDSTGLTAVELIVVAALLAILLAAVITPLVTGQFYWHRGESDVQIQREARRALERVIRDIRHAGFRSEGYNYIKLAKADEIKFEADLDNDGSAETIHFFRDGQSLKKGVQLTGEPEETVTEVADDVSSFSLSYYDTSDPPTAIALDGSGSVSGSDLGSVALVEAEITTTITRSGYTKDLTLDSEALIRR